MYAYIEIKYSYIIFKYSHNIVFIIIRHWRWSSLGEKIIFDRSVVYFKTRALGIFSWRFNNIIVVYKIL